MVLDNEVKLSTKYNYDLQYYKDIGYDTCGDFFIVKIEDLLKKSFTKVNVKCEYCDIEEFIPYYKWTRSMESIVKKYCCKSCKGKKIKESNLLRYGVTSVAKLQSSKDKSKKTNLNKYGYEFHSQSDVIKNKIRDTNLKNWGVENPMQSQLIKEKQKKTVFNIYGVDNISKLEEIKDKKRETAFSNFGVDHPLKSEEIKNKIKDSNLIKWGDEYFTKTEIYRKENYDIASDDFYLNYIENGVSLFKCDFGIEHNFEITKDVYSKRKLYSVGLCTVFNPVGENRSIKEKDLSNFISNLYSGEIINNYRDGKMEIDIYLPSLNLGFEFNGLYWHSNIYKEKDFHLNKTNFFKEKDIRIIHIWEDDWDNKRNIVESQIKYLLNNCKTIFARKCEVRELNRTKEVSKFLEENHIQGRVGSCLKLGLYYEDELVGLMTFDHYEGRNKMKDDEWNINRFCNKTGFVIIGGASKLFKYFIKNYKVSRVISYADKDWSLGRLYEKLGFQKINESDPDYKYILGGVRVHKSKLKKSKTGISESKLNIPKVWDCGKIKFEFIYNKKK